LCCDFFAIDVVIERFHRTTLTSDIKCHEIPGHQIAASHLA